MTMTLALAQGRVMTLVPTTILLISIQLWYNSVIWKTENKLFQRAMTLFTIIS